MSQKPSVDLAPSWRAAAVQAPAPSEPEAMSRDALRRKLLEPVTYTQPDGADLFPSMEAIKAFFRKLRRA